MPSDDPTGATDELSEARWLKAPATIIVLVACLLYAATLDNELVLDDAAIIPHHGALESPWDLPGIFSKPTIGFEPTTFSLPRNCTTTVLHRRDCDGWIRTSGFRVNSSTPYRAWVHRKIRISRESNPASFR